MAGATTAHAQCAISNTYDLFAALGPAGELLVWGKGATALCGLPGTAPPPRHRYPGPYTAIATGYRLLCAIDAEGTLWAWGYEKGPGPAMQPGGPWAAIGVHDTGGCGPPGYHAIDGAGALWESPGPGKAPRRRGPGRFWASLSPNGTLGAAVDGSLWLLGGAEPAPLPPIPGAGRSWLSLRSDSYAVATDSRGSLWVWPPGESAPLQVGGGRQWRTGGSQFNTLCAVAADGTLWASPEPRTPLRRIGAGECWDTAAPCVMPDLSFGFCAISRTGGAWFFPGSVLERGAGAPVLIAPGPALPEAVGAQQFLGESPRLCTQRGGASPVILSLA